MRYEFLTEEDGVKIYARIDDDGLCRVTCTENNPEYLNWATMRLEQITANLMEN